MSLKKNIAANYLSQFYVLAVSILILPVFIKLMGAEAYGLVAFFTMLQSWMMLLDLGMTPTMSREIARYRGGVLSGNDIRNVFNKLIQLFVGLAAVTAILMVLGSGWITTHWLKAEMLQISEIRISVMLMAVIVGIRWISGFLRAAVIGFEKMVWLSVYNSLFATLRFAGIIPVLIFLGNSPLVFFIYQTALAFLELIVIIMYVKQLMPVLDKSDVRPGKSIRSVMQFSLSIAFTSAVWVLVTQTDKLLLSKWMLLSEFGYYALAVQLAGGITLIAGPLSSAILPRLSKLEAEGNTEGLLQLYRESTRLMVWITGSVAAILVFFSEQLIYIWTGDMGLTVRVSPYLILYAIGNFILSVAAFPYYLQYAKGNLKFHIYGNIGFVVLLLPALYLVVTKYGGIGAGWVWIGINTLYFLIWVPFIHHHFAPGLNKKWYVFDIGLTVIAGWVVASVLYPLHLWNENRFLLLLLIAVCGIVIFLLNLSCSGPLRNRIWDVMVRRKGNNQA